MKGRRGTHYRLLRSKSLKTMTKDELNHWLLTDTSQRSIGVANLVSQSEIRAKDRKIYILSMDLSTY